MKSKEILNVINVQLHFSNLMVCRNTSKVYMKDKETSSAIFVAVFLPLLEIWDSIFNAFMKSWENISVIFVKKAFSHQEKKRNILKGFMKSEMNISVIGVKRLFLMPEHWGGTLKLFMKASKITNVIFVVKLFHDSIIFEIIWKVFINMFLLNDLLEYWNISAPLSICKSIFNISNKIVFKTYTNTKFVVVFIKIQIVCFVKRFAAVSKHHLALMDFKHLFW